MKRLVVGIIAAAVLVSTARTAMAQTRTVKAEMRTETAIVESIDAKTRTITLKRPDGTFVGTVAGPEVKRFAEIKVGNKVSAALAKLNVGNRVDIVWTEAALVSIEPGK
jgi:Cu/Ag efflux protein CusF